MKSIWIFTLILSQFLFGDKINYLSSLEYAKEYLSKNETDKALVIYNKTSIQYPFYPESYLEKAIIYFHQGFHDISLFLLEKALSLENNFVILPKKMDLYIHLAILYNYLNFYEKEKFFLYKIYEYSDTHKASPFYLTKLGKASFLIGINYLKKKEIENARKYLHQTIDSNYNKKISYLILAFLAVKDYEKNPSLKNRNSFLYYFRLLNNQVTVNSESFLLRKYQKYHEQVIQLYQSIQPQLFSELID